MTGTTVQHYRIREQLGAGGMGEVYRAEDVRLGRDVAIKFLSPALQADPESRGRLMTEARAASALRSPHIAAIYDIGEHEGAVFLVMEYVEGEVLARRLAKGPVPIPLAIDVALQTADALDEAHSRGIVHRDIKSGNLMVTPRGHVKVLDFGLAKFMTPVRGLSQTLTRSDLTLPGVVLGTVSYMSPEQALGRDLDHRSDIFSLGVVLYEAVAGRLPFAGSSAVEIIDRIIHHPAPPIGRLEDTLPPELETIINKALEKDPQSRYQSARELYTALDDLRRARLDRDRTTTTPGVRSAAPADASPPLQNAVAVMTFANITKEPADDWIGTGIAETVTADLKSIQGLSVIGRERIFEALKQLSSANVDVNDRVAIEVGRSLGATWLIGGGYQRVADLIRITARFVDVRTGALLGTVKIDGHISEIFGLQDKIVYELTHGLNLQLRQSEIADIERQETRSVEAYELYARGTINLRMATRESLDRAIYLFEKAVEHDADYAPAWAALGAAYDIKGSFLTMPELLEKAVACERRALAINPRLVEARVRLGSAFLEMGRYDEAIDAIRDALAIDPHLPAAHANLARAYWIGKGMIEEGIHELEATTAINPEAGYSYLQLGLLYTLVGEYRKAEEACRRAIDLQERYMSGREGLLVVGAHARLGYVFYRQGRYDDAIHEYERELQFLSSSDHALRDRTMIEVSQKLGAAYLRKGMADDAERHFTRALRLYETRLAAGADDPFTKYYIACVHALRGDVDRAIKAFEETLDRLGPLNRRRAQSDPDLERLRAHPRFQALAAFS